MDATSEHSGGANPGSGGAFPNRAEALVDTGAQMPIQRERNLF